MDDIYTIIREDGQSNIKLILSVVSRLHPNVEFTVAMEKEGQLSMRNEVTLELEILNGSFLVCRTSHIRARPPSKIWSMLTPPNFPTGLSTVWSTNSAIINVRQAYFRSIAQWIVLEFSLIFFSEMRAKKHSFKVVFSSRNSRLEITPAIVTTNYMSERLEGWLKYALASNWIRQSCRNKVIARHQNKNGGSTSSSTTT